ncbi:MAG: 30S ribosomal protein S13 [Candidatus Lokiarchaeota archaeon]|nr:30S ribosomal protein S13 [Candidatus Lokiarchaeota archaeon]
MDDTIPAIRPDNYREKVFFRKLRSQVDGSSKVERALTQIRGIGKKYAQLIIMIAKIDPNIRIGALEQIDLDRIEEIALNPEMHGVPVEMLNRKYDFKNGWNDHYIGNQLDITTKCDIDMMKRMKSFKGWRHRKKSGVRGMQIVKKE